VVVVTGVLPFDDGEVIEGDACSSRGDRRLDERTARALRSARIDAGMRQAVLAVTAGVSSGVISAAENGRGVPDYDSAVRLTRSLLLPDRARVALLEAAADRTESSSPFAVATSWAVEWDRDREQRDGRVVVTSVTPRFADGRLGEGTRRRSSGRRPAARRRSRSVGRAAPPWVPSSRPAPDDEGGRS
jgi:transcriptional regulator with XRE-family HTH domain